ncbi:hypothetical protein B0H13DRAFT_2308014 [Mycena leptocephala]|nr:hypothetical protein B0H13DRAFT_2308014 [Mycena leptocephala]
MNKLNSRLLPTSVCGTVLSLADATSNNDHAHDLYTVDGAHTLLPFATTCPALRCPHSYASRPPVVHNHAVALLHNVAVPIKAFIIGKYQV